MAAARFGDTSASTTTIPRRSTPASRSSAVASGNFHVSLAIDLEDYLRGIAENADQYLVDLEARERERTGIATLKAIEDGLLDPDAAASP